MLICPDFSRDQNSLEGVILEQIHLRAVYIDFISNQA